MPNVLERWEAWLAGEGKKGKGKGKKGKGKKGNGKGKGSDSSQPHGQPHGQSNSSQPHGQPHDSGQTLTGEGLDAGHPAAAAFPSGTFRAREGEGLAAGRVGEGEDDGAAGNPFGPEGSDEEEEGAGNPFGADCDEPA